MKFLESDEKGRGASRGNVLMHVMVLVKLRPFLLACQMAMSFHNLKCTRP